MAKPQAFLAIERTMISVLRAEWAKESKGYIHKLEPLLQAKKWHAAHDEVNRFNLNGVIEKCRKRLEELALSALLFGAHHAANGSVKDTSFAKGAPIPNEMHKAIDQLVHGIETNGAEYIRQCLHDLITKLQQEDPTSHLAKDDDISDEQLAETGGLQEPEQAAPKKRKLKKHELPLYIYRPLIHPEAFLAWVKAQGFTSTIPVADLHVTVLYSKTPVEWGDMGEQDQTITVEGGARAVHPFGEGAIVLEFESSYLKKRHEDLIAKGATSDYPDYRSHVTITYSRPEGLNLASITPFDGPLEFGSEDFEEIKKGGFNPDDLDEEVLKMDRLFKAVDQDLVAKLQTAFTTGGTVPVDLHASLTVSRLTSLGFLAESKTRGAASYQINEVLDGKTCPVCAYMHGRTFKTESQYDRLLRVLNTDDPQDLKSTAPWPDQSKAGLSDLRSMSEAELQANGSGSPPFHPNCRGILVMEGLVEPDFAVGGAPMRPSLSSMGDEDDVGMSGADQAQRDTPYDDNALTTLHISDLSPIESLFGGLSDDASAEGAAATAIDGLGTKELSAVEEETDLELGEISDKPNSEWTDDEVNALGTSTFAHIPLDDATCSTILGLIDDKKYNEALAALNVWREENGVPLEKDDQAPDDEDDTSPNAPKKKRKLHSAAGREQDYDDIASDSSSIAFDAGTGGDSGAPIDR